MIALIFGSVEVITLSKHESQKVIITLLLGARAAQSASAATVRCLWIGNAMNAVRLSIEGAGIVVDHKEHDFNFTQPMFEKYLPEMVCMHISMDATVPCFSCDAYSAMLTPTIMMLL